MLRYFPTAVFVCANTAEQTVFLKFFHIVKYVFFAIPIVLEKLNNLKNVDILKNEIILSVPYIVIHLLKQMKILFYKECKLWKHKN
mgnify:CR=1 FL=1